MAPGDPCTLLSLLGTGWQLFFFKVRRERVKQKKQGRGGTSNREKSEGKSLQVVKGPRKSLCGGQLDALRGFQASATEQVEEQ